MEKYIRVRDGAKIFVKIMGNGDLLLLLHGNNDNLNYFEKQFIDFSKHYKLIAIDTRGHGKSDDIDPSFDFEDLSKDILDIMDYLEIEKANILGFSDGANLALTFAKNWPERVEKLILNSPNKNIGQIKLMPRILTYISYYFLKFTSRIFRSLKNYFYVYSLLFESVKIKEKDYKKMDFPVLIIAGASDVIYLDSFVKIANKFKKSELCIVEKQGHHIAKKSPEFYNKVILDFLGRDKIEEI